MTKRKVPSLYYPPDFDPSKPKRRRKFKYGGPKFQAVRLMTPFSMKCNACGAYISKGRKFDARKETINEPYREEVKLFRFRIRCTRCRAGILFKTDPRNADYACEKGATRSFEHSCQAKLAEETGEERLDHLEREEVEQDPMARLETKISEARADMDVAEDLDNIIGAQQQLFADLDSTLGNASLDGEMARQECEDEEDSQQAFRIDTRESVSRVPADDNDDNDIGNSICTLRGE